MSIPPNPTIARRTAAMTPIGVERMGDQADALQDPAVLRLENLDTDLLPPAPALQAAVAAVHDDDANSYLPFFGHDRLRRAATALVERNARLREGTYDWRCQCFISAGGLSGVLNALLALIDPGDEVVLTSPTYVGLINRVRLAGGVPLVYVRREVKSYGTKRQIEGRFEAGEHVVVIDDIVTDGESKLEAIAPLEAAGLIVRDLVVLIDRQQGGPERLAARGYALRAVLTISACFDELEQAAAVERSVLDASRAFVTAARVA